MFPLKLFCVFNSVTENNCPFAYLVLCSAVSLAEASCFILVYISACIFSSNPRRVRMCQWWAGW